MTDQSSVPENRSYGCTFGCGRAYDYVVVTVKTGDTEFLCSVCYITLAVEMIKGITEQDSAEVQLAVATVGALPQAPMPEGQIRKSGHNAPVTANNALLIEEYDGAITVADLPDEFR